MPVKRFVSTFIILSLLALVGCGDSGYKDTYEVAKKLSNRGPLTDTEYVRRLETSEELLDQVAGIKIKAIQRKLYVLEKMLNQYENLKMWPKVIETAKKLVELQPSNIEWYLHQGRAHTNMAGVREESVEKAERSFRTALELEPDSIKAHYGLGILYGFHTGDIKLARRHLNKAANDVEITVKNRPEVVQARFALGKLEYQNGNSSPARETFKSILGMESISQEAKFLAQKNLGDVYRQMGSRELAKQHYHKAYELEPTDSQIRSRLRGLGVEVQDRFNRFE